MAITYVKPPGQFKPPVLPVLQALDQWSKGEGQGIDLTLQHKQSPSVRYRVLGFDPSTGTAVLAGEGKLSTSRPLRIKVTKTDAAFFVPKWSNPT